MKPSRLVGVKWSYPLIPKPDEGKLGEKLIDRGLIFVFYKKNSIPTDSVSPMSKNWFRSKTLSA